LRKKGEGKEDPGTGGTPESNYMNRTLTERLFERIRGKDGAYITENLNPESRAGIIRIGRRRCSFGRESQRKFHSGQGVPSGAEVVSSVLKMCQNQH
jgi:hypothetical protein